MDIQVSSWQLVSPSAPLVRASRTVDTAKLAPGEVVVEVAGCGVCHTDLGFCFDGVRTNHALPLTLGHEIAGTVVAGDPALAGRAVVVPAVLPCGGCAQCRDGAPNICRHQIFPGNDVHGGFASHVVVPGRFLCAVDRERLAAAGLALADLAVVADAVSTPYQAVLRAGLRAGDVAIFVGAGGVGAFGVQIARALGAHVVAVDVDAARLELARAHGAEEALDGHDDAKALRERVRAFVKARHLDPTRWKIFETSGTPAGQLTAFGLLTHGAVLMVVGFTLKPVEIRLSNLMAFDATARGTWACDPALYPAILDLVLDGKVKLTPFVERRPMRRIQETFDDLRAHKVARRPVLVPDFDEEQP